MLVQLTYASKTATILGPGDVKDILQSSARNNQAAFSVVVASLLGAVVGLRCTSSIGFQLRVETDQRFGLALRAAA